jgi:hypothetical protein
VKFTLFQMTVKPQVSQRLKVFEEAVPRTYRLKEGGGRGIAAGRQLLKQEAPYSSKHN